MVLLVQWKIYQANLLKTFGEVRIDSRVQFSRNENFDIFFSFRNLNGFKAREIYWVHARASHRTLSASTIKTHNSSMSIIENRPRNIYYILRIGEDVQLLETTPD